MWKVHQETEFEYDKTQQIVSELLQKTFARIVVFVLGGWATGQLLIGVRLHNFIPLKHLAITACMFLVSLLVLRLITSSIVAAHILWQVGMASGLLMSARFTGYEETLFLMAFLPGTATILFGWIGGSLSLSGLIVIVAWLAFDADSVPIDGGQTFLIILSGCVSTSIGYFAVSSLVSVTEWSIISYQQARRMTEDAMNQRLDFRQIQEDLIQSNNQLAQLSQRLKIANLAAEEARRAKEEFVANVSHELRTPLNMIIGFSEMITQAPQVYATRLPPKLLADIASIQRNSHHLLNLINDVLDLSQIDARQMALSRKWGHLQEIVATSVDAIRALFESKNLYLRVDLPAEPIHLYCDVTRIREVILNLLSNAGRLMDVGGVEIRAWTETDTIIVAVQDTGPGISQEDQERIFEPFHQIQQSVLSKQTGSGLGLTISKKFVEMHGGKLWLESTLGAGTTFFFSLPRVFNRTDMPDLPAWSRWFKDNTVVDARTRPFKAPKPRVTQRYVVVEHGKRLTNLLRRYLDEADVLTYEGLSDALDEIHRAPVQALLVNEAPGLQPSTLQSLPETPVFRCWIPDEADVTGRLGIIRYLVKPVTHHEMKTLLEENCPSPETILLVDDNPEALRLFTRMALSIHAQCRVIRASDGEQALTLMRRHQPDLVLLDLVMPHVDGFQVLAEKADDSTIRDIPVAVISSQDPHGSPISSPALTISHPHGFSAYQLTQSIQVISQILTSVHRQSD